MAATAARPPGRAPSTAWTGPVTKETQQHRRCDTGLARTEAHFQALRYFCVGGTDHASHAEQASVIRRYIRWRNRNPTDRALTDIVNHANIC